MLLVEFDSKDEYDDGSISSKSNDGSMSAHFRTSISSIAFSNAESLLSTHYGCNKYITLCRSVFQVTKKTIPHSKINYPVIPENNSLNASGGNCFNTAFRSSLLNNS